VAPPADSIATTQWLRRAMLDIVQRPPSPAELRAYPGATTDSVVQRLFGQLEAMEIWLEEELLFYLLRDNFRPDTPAIRALPHRLLEGKATVFDATCDILLSSSFSLRNPGNDTFTSVLLEQCLGLTVQDPRNRATLEAGKRMYDGQRAKLLGVEGASQADLVRIVVHDPRFVAHLLDRHHGRFFGAPLARSARAGDAERLLAEPQSFFALLGAWIASPDYIAALATPKRRTDDQFIRSLYMDLLERRPDPEELRNMRNALQSMADPTPVRAVLSKVILDSGQARVPEWTRGQEGDFVRTCFVRFLGREPERDEMERFVATAREPDCTPVHVVRALVESAAYQYY
jgi:hypothetical protein